MIPYFHIQDIPYFLQIGGHFSCCVNAGSSQLPINFSCNLLSPHSHQFLSPDFIACLHRRRNLQWPINLPSHPILFVGCGKKLEHPVRGGGDPRACRENVQAPHGTLSPNRTLVAGAVRQQLFQPHHSACLPQLHIES